jgi:catalase
VTGLVGRFKPAHPNDDFAQPSVFFRKVFNDQARTNLINNISNGMKTCRIDIRERMVRQFYKVDPEYGERAAKIVDVTHIKSHL